MKVDEIAEKVYTETKELDNHPIEILDSKKNLPFNSYTPKEFKYLQTGGNRIVYKKDNTVFKFEIGFNNKEKDKNHTQKEVEIWNKASDKQKENLADILKYDKNKYRWVQMKYYDQNHIITKVDPKKRKNIRKKLKQNNIYYNDGVVYNIYHNNKIIILDYGYRTRLIK